MRCYFRKRCDAISGGCAMIKLRWYYPSPCGSLGITKISTKNINLMFCIFKFYTIRMIWIGFGLDYQSIMKNGFGLDWQSKKRIEQHPEYWFSLFYNFKVIWKACMCFCNNRWRHTTRGTVRSRARAYLSREPLLALSQKNVDTYSLLRVCHGETSIFFFLEQACNLVLVEVQGPIW